MGPAEFFLFKPIAIYVTLLKISRSFWKTFRQDRGFFVFMLWAVLALALVPMSQLLQNMASSFKISVIHIYSVNDTWEYVVGNLALDWLYIPLFVYSPLM